MNNINWITLIIIGIFLMPILSGMLYPVSRSRIKHSLHSVLSSINFIISLFLALWLVRSAFSEESNAVLSFLEKHFPSLTGLIADYRYDIVAYIIALFVCISVIVFLLELIAHPLCRLFLEPFADVLSVSLDSANSTVRRICSGLWQLPRALWMVLLFSLLLNFYANFVNNPTASDYIKDSAAYQTIHKNVLHPILSAERVKKLPVLVSDAVRKAVEDFTPTNYSDIEAPNYWNLPVIKYFNGVTIDEAVQSNEKIDAMAKKIVGNETDAVKKARLLYEWVSKNIAYDNAKADIVMENPTLVESGSIVTYQTRTGVCFDYASLYVSMCRAVGVKVRMVSGLGFSGEEWGEHVWNQVYDPVKDGWINVDPTFGASGYNYFGNKDFTDNHRYDAVQAEW